MEDGRTSPSPARPWGADFAVAGIVKDAGDDPDVTHQALVLTAVRRRGRGSGVTFRAGEGVGTVTRGGLPLAVGEPAINPAPRKMMIETVKDVAALHGDAGDVEIEISIPGGVALANGTMNGRLGIVGGLSILGTTGVVVPFSCASWIGLDPQGHRRRPGRRVPARGGGPPDLRRRPRSGGCTRSPRRP